MSKKQKYEEIASSIIQLIGGKGNISYLTHCVTRLRFNLKDKGLVDQSSLKQLNGVLGCQWQGEQLQIIIGQQVGEVYKTVCSQTGISEEMAIEDSFEKPKEKWTLKRIGMNILDYMSGSMVPIIPAMLTAALCRTLGILFGPDLLGWLSADSDFIKLMNIAYEGLFYFLPVMLGYTAAKKLKCNIAIGMMLGAIFIAPSFIAMIGTVESFTVFGIPAQLVNYAQSVMPIILSVWVMSYVEKGLSNIIPNAISSMFTPFFTLLIMLPISLCFLAPLGNILGNYVGVALNLLAEHGGFLAVGIIGGLWQFLVITGMHQVLITIVTVNFLQVGIDGCVIVGAAMARFAIIGIVIGALLRMKSGKRRSENVGLLVASTIGGISEPVLYGLAVRFKRPLVALFMGGFVGGIYCGLMNTMAYAIAGNGIFILFNFVGGGTANIVHALIGAAISTIVSACITYFWGFEKKELAAFDQD